MDLLVIPNITNTYKRERAKDTLPQSGSGKIITTVEPKFIPNDEAVEIELDDNLKMRVRMIDCVGYMVEGATGHIENNVPRMVKTPWFEEEIEFIKAAEVGTRKVISEHSTIGIVVTTDGSITDIPRENYIDAEDKVIKELKELNKPFVILLNTTHPYSPEAMNVKKQMEEKYGVPVTIMDALNMKIEDINKVLESVLYEFPLKEIGIDLPEWIEALENEHWLKTSFITSIKNSVGFINKLKDIRTGINRYLESEFIGEVNIGELKLGEGTALLQMKPEQGLFFKILGEVCGYEIKGEHGLLSIMKELNISKREYDKISVALKDARETGYGMVPPQLDELKLEDPEIVKQGNRFGVKLRASAPSLHLIKANVETELSLYKMMVSFKHEKFTVCYEVEYGLCA